MPSPSFVRRIGFLEEHVNTLNELPVRVGALETQIVGMRRDITILQEDVKELRHDVNLLQHDVKELRGEVRAGDEETWRQMRVLHEEVISRIALLQEGQAERRKRR